MKPRGRSEAGVAERAAEALAHLNSVENDLQSERTRRLAAERIEYKHRRAAAAMPDAATVATLVRYESTIERALNRVLHELERLQAHRRGEAVPPRIRIDVEGIGGG